MGALLALATVAAAPSGLAAQPKPLRVLLITGGCCHDYAVQKDLLKAGLEARAHVVVDQLHSADSSTKPPLAFFGNPDYAKGYDVVIHDECAAAVSDPGVIKGVLAPHRAGIPGVNLHCAMHSYRIGDQKVPTEAGSERAMWFDYLGIQSSPHGPKLPIPVTTLDAKHPIIAGLGWSEWTTGNEELYNNVLVRPTARGLQHGTQDVKQKDGSMSKAEAVVTWVNDFNGTRVFSTTLGHYNETVADARYLDLVTRGLLWACGKLNDEYLKPGTHPSLPVPAAAPSAAPAPAPKKDKKKKKTAAAPATTPVAAADDALPTPEQVSKMNPVTESKVAEILKEVKVPAGFEATVFATPPAVNYPVFVSAAADGTLYVSSDGNGSLDRALHRGRILRVRDANADGRADEVKVFVADVDSPRGLVWDHDRLYVLHPPHISAFIDKDGDGVADEPVGHVGGEQHGVGGGGAGFRFDHLHVAGHLGEKIEGDGDGVDGIEERFLVFLEVAVVGHGQTFERDEERGEIADEAPGLAAVKEHITAA